MEKTMKHFATALALSVSLLAGCATLQGPPDWISGTAAKYPAPQYLVGRGQAASGEEARDRARADLAKIFEVNVAVESEDVQAFRSGAGGKYEGHSARRITARTERVIEGIEIAETWQDPMTKNFHALAVLPRLKAGTTLRQEIARVDDATRLQLERARDAQDLLLKIAAAAHAVTLQSDRAALQKTLRVIDPVGVGSQPSVSIDRLRADLDALVKRVKLAPRVPAEAHSDLEPMFKGAVAAAGFLADTDATPDYALEANLALDDLGRQDGWYWQRGVLEVRLMETANNRVRGTKRWQIKSSSLTREGSVQRAFSQADVVLKKELRGALISFAAGQSSH
jgi:hypothetical protein